MSKQAAEKLAKAIRSGAEKRAEAETPDEIGKADDANAELRAELDGAKLSEEERAAFIVGYVHEKEPHVAAAALGVSEEAYAELVSKVESKIK